MSIFEKDCPECAAPNSTDAVRCDCGYCFDPEALAGIDASEYAQEQDRLYRDYLAARIVQQEAEVIVAREQAKADSGNALKGAAALVAEQTLNTLQAEFRQISLRASARPTRRSTLAPSQIRAAPVANRKPAVALRKAPAHKPTTLPTPPPAKTPAPTTIFARHELPRNESPVATTRASPATELHLKSTPSAKRARPRPVVDSVRPKPVPVVATAPTPAPVVVKKSQPVAASKQSVTPSADFKKLQARKAAAITRFKIAATAAEHAPAPAPERAQRGDTSVNVEGFAPIASAAETKKCPSCSATVTLDLARCRCGFTFPQHAREMPGITLATLGPSATQGTQECPNCTATLSTHVTKCGCGYTFARAGDEVPSLALDAGSLSILTDGINPNRTSRRR